jgi:hypothetical protein
MAQKTTAVRVPVPAEERGEYERRIAAWENEKRLALRAGDERAYADAAENGLLLRQHLLFGRKP